jgi:predicted PurR-regulated permease PerM
MNGRKLIPLVLLGAVIYLLFQLGDVLLPFVLAAAIAYVLNPLVAFLEIRGLRRERAVLIVYLVLVCTAVGLAYLGFSAAVQSTSTISADLPAYVQKLRAFVHRYTDLIDKLPVLSQLDAGGWLRERLGGQNHTWAVAFLERIPSLLSVHLVPVLEMTLLVPFLVFFFMLDGPAFLDRLLDFVPARYVEMTLSILLEINYSLGNYLRSILVQAFFMGVAAGIGYGLMGLDYTVYIAAWVALTSMVPLLGAISAALAGGLVALVQWGTITGLLKVLIVFAAIHMVDNWVLQPLILRKAVRIHPLMLVFTLMAGAALGGFWGLLFDVPAACMLKVLFTVGWQWYQTEYNSRAANLPAPAEQIPLV